MLGSVEVISWYLDRAEVCQKFSLVTWIWCTVCTRISYIGPVGLGGVYGVSASIQRDPGCHGSSGLVPCSFYLRLSWVWGKCFRIDGFSGCRFCMGCGKQLALEVKWCCRDGWVGEESREPIWCVKAEFSREPNPGSLMSWYGHWHGYWACQKFRAFEIMLTTEEQMYNFQFFSRWHNLSLVYILFNDSGNLSLLNHFLIRFVHSFSSTLSDRWPYVYPFKRHPCCRNASASLFSKSHLKSSK